jgi:PQQ-like domain
MQQLRKNISTIICLLACVTFAQAQRGGGNDWLTENADAQRTATIKSDAKINKDSVTKPETFKFIWKLKLKNQPTQMNNLMPPATLERLIGFKGFRMLGFVAGSDNNLITIDTDLGRFEWEKKLPAAASATSTITCPGGMTTGVVRPTTSVISTGGGGGFGGRSQPAKSTVGEAGAGAANLVAQPPQQIGPPGPPPGMQQPRPARPGAPPIGAGFGGVSVVYALAGDGMLHGMHLSNGAPYQDPIKFLPAGANASGLILVDGIAYAATTNGCGGAANGLYTYDFESKQVANWKGEVVGGAGAAFGGDGTVYVATTSGITALEPKTLQVKSSYAGQGFSSTPVVFQFKDKTMIAAATNDGSVHLLDAANLSSAVATTSAAGKDSAPSSLTSYQDANGTRWILAAHNGALPSGFTGTAGTKGAILAWKLSEEGGKISLQPGWASRNLVSPLTPTIINGVVFATSSGEFKTNDSKMTAAARAARSGKAVLYALDGATGKELWSSGTTITSFARGGALSGGMGQLYLTTYDGTLYAFGYPMEH